MTRSRSVVIVGAWLVSWVGLWLSDADPSAIALAGIIAVIATVGIVVLELGRSVQPMRWPLPPQPGAADLAAQRVPRTLRDVDASVRSQPNALNGRLVGLVDDRINAHHGCDRHTAPEAADGLLTPLLRGVVAGPPRRPLTQRELWDILNDIEAL